MAPPYPTAIRPAVQAPKKKRKKKGHAELCVPFSADIPPDTQAQLPLVLGQRTRELRPFSRGYLLPVSRRPTAAAYHG